MNGYGKQRLAVARRQAKALERIASALEREPEAVELGEIDVAVAGVITWQDALRVMKATCIEADECGPGCPMNEWCQTFNRHGSAPAKWEPIEKDEEAEV